MRLYFKDEEHYPATYSFKDEVDGTTGTDIGFSAHYSNSATNPIIVSDYQNHKKVLKVNSGDTYIFQHLITPQSTSGIVEFWYCCNLAASRTNIKLKDGATSICYIRLNAANIMYYHGAAQTDSGVNAVNNIWMHYKIEWYADNTWDLWLDGILVADGKDTNNNMGSGISLFEVTTYNKEDYIDAWGDPINDTDYTVGDNAQDWDWTRVSKIITFPEVTSRNNIQGVCSITLRDFEGGLYSTWEPRDLMEMLITDDTENRAKDCNILFRGILTNKRFHSKDLVLELSGIGIHLYRNSFGTDEEEDYILKEGYIKGNPALEHSNKLYLQYKDSDGNFQDFAAAGWELDYWISEDRNVGILIKDTTAGYGTETWDAESITLVGKESYHDQYGTEVGVFGNTIGFDDGDWYVAKLTPVQTHSYGILYATPVIEGVVIDSTTDFLKSIKIEWNYKIRSHVNNVIAVTTIDCILQIYNTDSAKWEDIPGSALHFKKEDPGYYGTPWCQGVSTANGGNGNEYILKDTDVNLQHYFDKVGNDYDHLSGLRVKIVYECVNEATTAFSYVDMDFFQVTPQYHGDDIAPVMRHIDSSGIDGNGSYIKVYTVDYWDEMGLTVDEDTFQFGQNIIKIIQDVGTFSGQKINITDQKNLVQYAINVYPTGDTATIMWNTTGGNHYGELDDANDATYVDTGTNAFTDIYTFPTINLREGYVTNIKIYHRQKCDIIDKEVVNISYSTDGGSSWSSTKNDDLTVAWVTENSEWTGLEIEDMSDFQVKLLYTQLFAGSNAYVSELYVDVRYVISNWTKYMARKFKGKHCIEVLRPVLLLAGGEWMEDYINNQIKLIKKADFVDSGVTLDQTDYDHNWEFEDQCNQIKYVYVWGKTSVDSATKTVLNTKASAVDLSVVGENSVQIIDDNIWTDAEAQEIANTQLALLKDKRPSIRIPLNGVNKDLQMGTYANITMARPTIGATDYHIRMITRKRRGKTGIETIVYVGFGETEWDEKIIKAINLANNLAHKSLSDKLTSSPYNVGVGG